MAFILNIFNINVKNGPPQYKKNINVFLCQNKMFIFFVIKKILMFKILELKMSIWVAQLLQKPAT